MNRFSPKPDSFVNYLMKSTNWLKFVCRKSNARFGIIPNRIVAIAVNRMTAVVPAGITIFASSAAGRKNICVMIPK
jgi:hypothetical protein